MLAETQVVNYPDILGVITGGRRLNVDMIQCALTTRPGTVGAGQNFEVLFLVQNVSDVDIDVTIDMVLPDRDSEKKRSMFFSRSSRLLVGLQPAEVGYVMLPAACSPKTSPSRYYNVAVDVKIERVNRSQKASRVRDVNGGSKVVLEDLNEKQVEEMRQLQALNWSADHRSMRNHVEATFEVTQRSLANLRQFKPGWESIWTLDNYLDDYILTEKVREHLNVFLPGIKKEEIFKPLLIATQQRFEGVYPLRVAEAIYITKLMVRFICDIPLPKPTHDNLRPEMPQWYKDLLRILFRESRLRDYPAAVVSDNLYPSLLQDSIMHAFDMLITVLKEDFGDRDERLSHAEDIVRNVKLGRPLSFGQVYLPLILGGVIANARVTMPRENIRETLFALSKAKELRYPERNENNDFIFKLLDTLIDRELDHLGGSL